MNTADSMAPAAKAKPPPMDPSKTTAAADSFGPDGGDNAAVRDDGPRMRRAKSHKVGFAAEVQIREFDAPPIDERSSMMRKSSCRKINTLNTKTQYKFVEEEVEEVEGGNVEEVEENKRCCTRFCAIMDAYPVSFVIGSAAIGIGLGIGLSFWNPEDPSGKITAIMWIGLLGDLFIRALKCVVLPLVFVSIAVSVMDMLSMGGAGLIVGSTIGLYVVTTICAALIGVVTSLIFSGFYDVVPQYSEVMPDPHVQIGCGTELNADGTATHYLRLNNEGIFECSDVVVGSNNTFLLFDVNGYFQQSMNAAGPVNLSLGESIYQGLFMQMIGVNMFGLFVDENFLGVIILGAGFGVALTRLSRNTPEGVSWSRILTIQLLEELMEVFMLFILWIIKITPFAIISLIAAAIGRQNDIGTVMEQLGYLMAAIMIGFMMQIILVYSGLYASMVRKNPFNYLRQLTPAWLFAFACASSAATIPISIDTVVSTGEVSDGVARFVIPLGSSVNMDGGAVRIICNTIWLAYQNGIVPTAGDYILLVMCSTLGSMGAAPVPNASLVLVITSYATVFGATSDGGPPAGLAYLFAIEWLMDRFSTITNITGDMTVSAIIEDKLTKKMKKDAAEDLGLAKKEGDFDEEVGVVED